MIAFNAVAQLASLGGTVVVQTLYLILAARILGVEDFGRFSLVFSISQILLIGGDLGLHNTALRRISFEPRRSTEILPLFVSLKLIGSALLTLAVAGIAFFLRETAETRFALLLFGFGLFFHSLSLGLNIAFQAHGKLYFAGLNSFLLSLVQAVAGLVGLLQGGRVVWLGWAYTLAASFCLWLNWEIFRRKVHRVEAGSLRGAQAFLRESLPVGLGSLFDAAAARIAFSLLAGLAGSYATGIFSASARFTGALKNAPVALFSAVLPAMAQFQADPRQVKALFNRYLAVLAAAAVPVVALLYAFSDRLILLIYGPDYTDSAPVLRLLSFSLLPACASIALKSVMVSQEGLYQRLPYVTASAMLVNVAANWWLIPFYGGLGAAGAQVISEAASALFYAAGVWSFLRGNRESGSRVSY